MFGERILVLKSLQLFVWQNMKQSLQKSQIHTLHIFERIGNVPRQSEGTYTRHVAIMKTGNLHNGIGIRIHFTEILKIFLQLNQKIL